MLDVQGPLRAVHGPDCNHLREGVVTTHPEGKPETGRYASTTVCARPRCIADAVEWAKAVTGLRHAFHRPDAAT